VRLFLPVPRSSRAGSSNRAPFANDMVIPFWEELITNTSRIVRHHGTLSLGKFSELHLMNVVRYMPRAIWQSVYAQTGIMELRKRIAAIATGVVLRSTAIASRGL